METPLVDGKALAEALGVSGAAVSTAAKEGRPCAGEPVHRWVRREGGTAARGYAVPEAKRKEYGIAPFEEEPFEEEPGSAEDASAESSFGEDVEGAGGNWAADIDAGDIDRLARRLTAAIGARVATSLYEEMGPWLKTAIRAGVQAGEWPPRILKESLKEIEEDIEEEGPVGGTQEADGEEGAPEEIPSGPGGEGPSPLLGLIASAGAGAPGPKAPGPKGSADSEESAQPGQVQGEAPAGGEDAEAAERAEAGQGAEARESAEADENAEADDQTPWRERLLRGLVEEEGLERVDGGAPPDLSESKEEKGFADWLRAYGEGRRRLAVEEGRIADAEGEARESLYRLLTSEHPFG